MRILLVNDRPPGPGSGVEVHVDRLRRALSDHGHRVEVFSGRAHRGPAKVLDVWDPFARRRLAEFSRSFKPDIVHHHNVLRELSVSVLGVPRSAGTVLSVHDYRMLRAHEGPESERAHRPLTLAKAAKGSFDRRVARRAVDRLVAVSEDLARQLRAAGFADVDVVANFAEPWDDATATALGRDVVYAGRLSSEKGLDVLIRAFAEAVPANGAGTRLRLAGVGPERSRLEALAGEVAPGRVMFEGLLDEAGVLRLLRDARVVCAPSTRITEGAPLIVIEAMHGSRPIVGTESPAFRELLGHDERGIVVPWGDIGGLRDALSRLLADDALAERIGAAARRRAREEHSPQVAVEHLIEVYRSALEERRDRVSR